VRDATIKWKTRSGRAWRWGRGVLKSGARWALCRVPTGNRLGGCLARMGTPTSFCKAQNFFHVNFCRRSSRGYILLDFFQQRCEHTLERPQLLPSSHRNQNWCPSPAILQTVTGARIGGEWTSPAIETLRMHWRFDIRLAVPKLAWRCGWNGTGAFKGQTRQFLASLKGGDGREEGPPLAQDRDEGPHHRSRPGDAGLPRSRGAIATPTPTSTPIAADKSLGHGRGSQSCVPGAPKDREV
jgi:hypothetical protein